MAGMLSGVRSRVCRVEGVFGLCEVIFRWIGLNCDF